MKQILFCLAALLISTSASTQTKVTVKDGKLVEIKEEPPKVVETLPDTLLLDGVTYDEAVKAFSSKNHQTLKLLGTRDGVWYKKWYLTSVTVKVYNRVYIKDGVFVKERYLARDIEHEHPALTLLIFAIILFFTFAMAYPLYENIWPSDFLSLSKKPARAVIISAAALFLFGALGWNPSGGFLLAIIGTPVIAVIYTSIIEEEGFYLVSLVVGLVVGVIFGGVTEIVLPGIIGFFLGSLGFHIFWLRMES